MQSTQKNSPDQRAKKCSTARAISQFIVLTADQLQSATVEVAAETDSLVRAALAIGGAARELLGDERDNRDVALQEQLATIVRSSSEVAQRIQSLDRFYQRLSHVQDQLRLLSHHLDCEGPHGKDTEWSAFLDEVRGGFTMEAERQLFDAVYAPGRAGTTTRSPHDAISDPVIF